MRPLPPLLALAFAVAAALLGGGCSVLGLGKKPSPYQGVLRFEMPAVLRVDQPLRLVLYNDSPRAERIDACRHVLLERFNGVAWLPVPGYRACAPPFAPAPVALAPGDSATLVLAPVAEGAAYRVVRLADGAPPISRTGRSNATQSSLAFDVVR